MIKTNKKYAKECTKELTALFLHAFYFNKICEVDNINPVNNPRYGFTKQEFCDWCNQKNLKHVYDLYLKLNNL